MTVKKSFRPFAHVTLKMVNLDSFKKYIKVFRLFLYSSGIVVNRSTGVTSFSALNT